MAVVVSTGTGIDVTAHDDTRFFIMCSTSSRDVDISRLVGTWNTHRLNRQRFAAMLANKLNVILLFLVVDVGFYGYAKLLRCYVDAPAGQQSDDVRWSSGLSSSRMMWLKWYQGSSMPLSCPHLNSIGNKMAMDSLLMFSQDGDQICRQDADRLTDGMQQDRKRRGGTAPVTHADVHKMYKAWLAEMDEIEKMGCFTCPPAAGPFRP